MPLEWRDGFGHHPQLLPVLPTTNDANDGIVRVIVTHSVMMVTRSEEVMRPMVWSELTWRPVESRGTSDDGVPTAESGSMGVMRRVRVDQEVTFMTEMLLRPYIKAQTAITALRDREEGQGITEYALIIASIAILLIVAMLFLAGKINVLFHKTGTSVEKPGPLP